MVDCWVGVSPVTIFLDPCLFKRAASILLLKSNDFLALWPYPRLALLLALFRVESHFSNWGSMAKFSLFEIVTILVDLGMNLELLAFSFYLLLAKFWLFSEVVLIYRAWIDWLRDARLWLFGFDEAEVILMVWVLHSRDGWAFTASLFFVVWGQNLNDVRLFCWLLEILLELRFLVILVEDS